MKYAFIILFLFLSSLAGATTYYIDPSGNNANNGSSSSPWETLAYACSKVTTPGDIIHVNAGTFTETSQCILALGVSIVGVGNTSIIHSHYSTDCLIYLYSGSNANGNQSISYLQIEGGTTVTDLVGQSAIKVIARNNVTIHDCTFRNFEKEGVIFYSGTVFPNPWITGCSFYNNIVTNCSRMTPGQGDSGMGALNIGGTQGMLVYGNTITNNLRASGNNGYGIKYYGDEGLNKGLKIYNNTITQTSSGDAPSGFNFCIEMWAGAGGFEIYNNVFHGCLDISNCQRDLTWYGVTYPEGAYSFGTKIYNNFIGWDSPMPIGSGDGEYGMRIEANCDYMYVYNNHFKNLGLSIESSMFDQTPHQSQHHMYFYYNVFENIGSSSAINSKGWGIRTAGDINCTYNEWHVLNNVFSAMTSGGSTMYAIGVPGGFDGSVVTNITIRNNIIQNFSYAAIEGSSSAYSADGVSIENNIFYNNGYNNAVRSNTTGWLHYTNQNNKPGVVPLFVSTTNFNIQSNSPAINAGLDVGLTTDYAGNAVQKLPEIGAYESGSAALIQATPVYQSSVVANATPSLVEMSYNLSLDASIVPAVTSFNILVNSVALPISKVAISGIKVQLTLSSAIKYGDIITVSYTKPVTNALQATTGGMAGSISSKTIINNLTAPTKDGTTVTVNMTISPNHVHNILNVILAYSSTPTIAMAPEIIRISNSSGTLFIEKLLVTGVTNIKIPLNLRSGIYIVKMLANGLEMVSQKMIVY